MNWLWHPQAGLGIPKLVWGTLSWFGGPRAGLGDRELLLEPARRGAGCGAGAAGGSRAPASDGGLEDLAVDVLQVGFLRGVQLDVVLGQDLEDGPQLQPPLLLGDAVPAEPGRWVWVSGVGGWGKTPKVGVGHLLEVRLLLELGDGLEDEAALAHAQQTGRVGGVGEDAAWVCVGNCYGPLLGAG